MGVFVANPPVVLVPMPMPCEPTVLSETIVLLLIV